MNFSNFFNQILTKTNSHPLQDKLSYQQLLLSPNSFRVGIVEKASKHEILDKVGVKVLLVGKVDLIVDKNTRVSKTDSQNHRIIIGGQPIPQNRKNDMIFLDHEYDYEKEIFRKYSHELSHIVAHNTGNLNQKFNQFYKNIIVRSRQSGKGFSLIGSIDFYKNQGVNTQATEDITEMINMYITDIKLLKKWLGFLVNVDENFSNKYKVPKISIQTANYIYDQIENGVALFLES